MSTLDRIRAHCLTKDGAYEDHPWGEVVFKVGGKGKIFCFCGGDPLGVTVKTTHDEQAALTQLPHIVPAPYLHKHGWVRVELVSEDLVDLALDLIDQSYLRVAPKRKTKRPNP